MNFRNLKFETPTWFYVAYSRPQLQAPVLHYIYDIYGTQMSQKNDWVWTWRGQMTQRMGAQRRSDAAGLPYFHQNAMSNPYMFSCCHAIHFTTFLRWHFQIVGVQLTSYMTYIQDSTFLQIFEQHVVLRTSFPAFDLLRSLRPVQPLGSTGKLGPNWKRFSSAEAIGQRVSFLVEDSLSLDVLRGEPRAQ